MKFEGLCVVFLRLCFAFLLVCFGISSCAFAQAQSDDEQEKSSMVFNTEAGDGVSDFDAAAARACVAHAQNLTGKPSQQNQNEFPLLQNGLWSTDAEDDNRDEIDPAQAETVRQDILDYAHTFMGVPYRWGGTTPDGFDCSGFIYYVFKEYGLELPRVSRYQQREAIPREFDELLPGDLIFFSGRTHVNHAGIVTRSDGEVLEMIHASSSLGVSVVDVYASTYWKPRLHSAGTYLELYDYFKENPELAERVKRKEPEAVKQVENFVRETERKRRTRVRAALALRAGTGGLGGELTTELLSGIHLRLGYSQLSFSNSMSSSMLNKYGRNTYSSSKLSLLINMHVTSNFYFSGGGVLYRGENNFAFDDDSRNSFRSLTIDPADVEGLQINHEVPRSVYPYFGLGYGRAFSRNRFVKAAAELGFVYQTSMQSTLTATSGLTDQEIQQQEQLLNDNNSRFNLIPMLNVQVSFRIF